MDNRDCDDLQGDYEEKLIVEIEVGAIFAHVIVRARAHIHPASARTRVRQKWNLMALHCL